MIQRRTAHANPVAYHGTARAFAMSDAKPSIGDYGPGFYFTTLHDEASTYARKGLGAGRVFECTVELKKPIYYHQVFLPADIDPSLGIAPEELEPEDLDRWHELNGLSKRLGEALWDIIYFASKGQGGAHGDEGPAIRKLQRGGYDGIIVYLRKSGRKVPGLFGETTNIDELEVVSDPVRADRTYYIVFDPASLTCVATATPNPIARARRVALTTDDSPDRVDALFGDDYDAQPHGRSVYVTTPAAIVESSPRDEGALATAQWAASATARPPWKEPLTIRLGRGNFGEAYLVHSKTGDALVKVAARDDGWGRPWDREAQIENFVHEAGVANELRALGFTVVPETTYVLLDNGWPALVREYGDTAKALTLDEYVELERQLTDIEMRGWRVRDDMTLYRRPNGSVFVGDLGMWEAPTEGFIKPSDLGFALDIVLTAQTNLRSKVQLVSLPRLVRLTHDIERELAVLRELGTKPLLLSRAVHGADAAVQDRERVGLPVPNRTRVAIAEGQAVVEALRLQQPIPPPQGRPGFNVRSSDGGIFDDV